jgi:hypothetical protein
MRSIQLINNYQADLLKSQNTPLLIELTLKDINSFNKQLANNAEANIPFLLAQKIYDKDLTNNSTNIIAIDGDNCQQEGRFYLLENMLDQLSPELKGIKNVGALKETLKGGLSVATGGLLNQFVGTYIEKAVDYIFDEVGEHFSNLLLDTVTDKIDVSALAIKNIEGFLQDTSGDSLGDFIGNASKHQLHLSSSAITEFNTLSKDFSKSNKHNVFQLTFKIILAISLESPKVIYINNPHKLDDNSLAIISLLLSYAKDQKYADKHLGISFIYTYNDTNFQPYCEVADNLKQKQRLLDDQRRFAQRYAMLERPSSDIPKVAVKSSLFVGRTEELKQLQGNFEQRERVTISVISGEPGVGKTALVNKHLAQITENKTITLTLLNEVGHTSSNAGLSSLEKSIIDEATRLSFLKSWKEKGMSGVKGLATTDNVLKIIGTIFNGADKVYNVAKTVHERVMVDSHILSIKQGGMGDLDNLETSQKEKQFDKLDEAIKTLQLLSDPIQPIVLFIDDCQWIDDNSCEYILTRLAKKVPLYIVTSIRPSDAATLLKQHVKRQSLHEYSIALLKAIATKGHQGVTSAIDTSDIACKAINLNGFDKKALNELVSLVIQGDQAQYETLTNTIFNEISGPGETSIITLFAIETINMLCDEELYSKNKTTRLIIDNPLRFNSEITGVIDLAKAIKETFDILQKKYENSLSHYEKSAQSKSFTLMAYAIMEERLHLLKIYFLKHGNAAVNTLLFSSLLGAPFSSNIVKSVLEALATTELPLLEPLKDHIKEKDQEVGLTTEHYVIIDEVYEILSRYNLNDDKYRYRHSLLHIFLDRQLDYLLETELKEETVLAKDQMFELCHHEMKQCFDENDVSGLSPVEAFEQTLYEQSSIVTLLKIAFANNNEKWADLYFLSLFALANSYATVGRVYDAIQIEEKARERLKALYNKQKPYWSDAYCSCLNNLAINYHTIGRMSEALELEEEVCDIQKEIYSPEPNKAEHYILNLNNIAQSYKDNNQEDKAKAREEEAYKRVKPLYEEDREYWKYYFTDTITNLADSYIKIGRESEAIVFLEDVCDILRVLETEQSIDKIKNYAISLNTLADSYNMVEQFKDAIDTGLRCNTIVAPLYDKHESRWEDIHTACISNLGVSYNMVGQFKNAIAYLEPCKSILAPLHDKTQSLWTEYYTICLSRIAHSYQGNDQVDKAIITLELFLSIVEPLHKNKKSRWVNEYTGKLNQLACLYINLDQNDKGMPLLEKNKLIITPLYNSQPRDWVEIYVCCLTSLVETYVKVERLDEARAFNDEIRFINDFFIPNLESNDYYAFKELANFYSDLERFGEALNFYEHAEAAESNLGNQEGEIVCQIYQLNMLRKLGELNTFDVLAQSVCTKLIGFGDKDWQPHRFTWFFGIWGVALDARGDASQAKEKLSKMHQLITKHGFNDFNAFVEILTKYGF